MSRRTALSLVALLCSLAWGCGVAPTEQNDNETRPGEPAPTQPGVDQPVDRVDEAD